MRKAAGCNRSCGGASTGRSGPPRDDHYGVGVRYAGTSDRAAGAAHEDTVRDVIHAFNEIGLRALDPNWAGGRPRRISTDDEAFIVTTATGRPTTVGRPFTRWSIRKLADYLATNPDRPMVVGRERLRQLLREHGVTFQRTRTWKESSDPNKEAKLDRIEQVTSQFPDRCFRLRPVRAAVDPATPRQLVVTQEQT